MKKLSFQFSSLGRNSGFTLIELMIAVVVIGILAAIAIPNYSAYVIKGRRVDAKTALLELAAREERYFATNNKYTITVTDLGYVAATNTSTFNAGASSTVYYTVAISGTPATDFTGTATPIGNQASDTTCGSFAITNLGVQTVTGAGTNCW